MRVTTLQIIYMAFIIIRERQIYVNSSDSQKVATIKVGISEEYLADIYNEKLSRISGGNYNVKEADDSKVDESSKEHLDFNIISSTYSRETTKHHAKDLGKRNNKKNEYETISNYVIDLQEGIIEEEKKLNTAKVYKEIFDTGNNFGEINDNHNLLEVTVKQSINNIENNVGINEESYESEKFIDEDDGESYIMPDVESFWDAVETFINIHSERPAREDPQEGEDLYEYLYTPSGNSPGIDQFLDILLLVKDIRDSVERIGKDTQWTGEKDNIYENTKTSPTEMSKGYEVHKNMDKKKDDYMSHEEYGIHKSTKKLKKSRSNRSKRSHENKLYQHKSFSSSFGMTFPILRFDLSLSSLEFEPLMDPFPDDQ